VSVIPSSETTQIKLTTHMLVSHGKTLVEIWMADADEPIKMVQSYPRLNVCQVITCHLCYDRWVNVSCYDIINWSLILGFVLFVTIFVIITRQVTNCFGTSYG